MKNKMVKRILTLALASILSFGLIACGNSSKAETEATSYTYEMSGAMGDETLEFDLYPDGTIKFWLPGHANITDVYQGTYERDGDTVKFTGLKNVDENAEHPIPGLWEFIDGTTGDGQITVDDAAGTFAP